MNKYQTYLLMFGSSTPHLFLYHILILLVYVTCTDYHPHRQSSRLFAKIFIFREELSLKKTQKKKKKQRVGSTVYKVFPMRNLN